MNITYEYYWAGVAVFTANNSDHNHARKANNLGLKKLQNLWNWPILHIKWPVNLQVTYEHYRAGVAVVFKHFPLTVDSSGWMALNNRSEGKELSWL